jgi:hypothetical protein
MRNYEAKLVDSSRIVADMLVEDIGNDPVRFDEMLQIFLRDTYPLSMRAARVLALCAEKYPELIKPHIPKLFASLNDIKVEGVRRGLINMLCPFVKDLTEDELGLLTDKAFIWLSDPKEAIAIRYYSIEILKQIVIMYPDLVQEFIPILLEINKNGSPGLVSASRQTMEWLAKEFKNPDLLQTP